MGMGIDCLRLLGSFQVVLRCSLEVRTGFRSRSPAAGYCIQEADPVCLGCSNRSSTFLGVWRLGGAGSEMRGEVILILQVAFGKAPSWVSYVRNTALASESM